MKIRNELIIPGVILLIGFTWIAVADFFVASHRFISQFITASDTYRDIFFVTAVAIIIYLLLRRQRRKNLQSEKEYQVLFDSSPVPMWIFDRETLAFLHVNRAAIEHYGYSRHEFLSMTIRDIRPPAEQQRLVEYIRHVRSEAGHSDTWQHLKKNGEVIIVQVVSDNVIFKGRVRRLAVANDITELRRAGEKISQQNRQLRDIAFHTSHIVRAPLANILALINLIEANGYHSTENIELLPLLRECAIRLDKTLMEIIAETVAIEEENAHQWNN